jgi:hypothetical protein
MSSLEEALQVAAYGFDIFPAKHKRPLITSWKTGTSREPGVITAWWKQFPAAEIGVPMPPGTVAIDIDDIDAVKRAEADGLEFPETAWQKTRTEGHYQRFHVTDPTAGDVPQVVGRGGIKMDTRAGGKGYVIAYEAAAFDTRTWTPAPSWVYESAYVPQAPRDPGAPLSTHAELISWLGSFVNSTKGQFDEAMLLSILKGMYANGRIVSADPAWPWSEADFKALARDAANFEVLTPSAPLLIGESGPADEGLGGMDAADLLKLDLPPLAFAFVGLIPEGLGVIGAPPKAGKSLLMYQAAVSLTAGSDLLGQKGEPRPVRYYALEDGRRRSQSRIKDILQGRPLGKGFELRWTAPKLGGPLEEEVNAYLIDHPKGVVIVDVLGKVRPTGKSGLNAYDEDYSLLTGIHRVTQKHPGSVVLFVTHDRKAGSEDWMTRITGTRGVTGAADFIIFINRHRGDSTGTVYVTGRDIEDLSIPVAFEGYGWRVATPVEATSATAPAQSEVLEWLEKNGPAMVSVIAAGVGKSRQAVNDLLKKLELAGMAHFTSGEGWEA